MSKHTPGPWHINDHAHDEEVVYIEADRYGVASIFTDTDKVDSTELANARLIAAAPELLEALKNIENDDGHIPSTIWNMCKAAIAKAEG